MISEPFIDDEQSYKSIAEWMQSDDYERNSNTLFHVFGIDYSETPAMINRLKTEKKSPSRVARSKISETNLKINPIDSIALKVCPIPK